MDKYNELSEKLSRAIKVINNIKPKSNQTEEFLSKFKEYIRGIKENTENKSLMPSNGALMGLLRWLSDFSELEECDDLWNIINEIEDYYCKNF